MIAPTIDWNRFEFTCAREDLNIPMPSPEAEAIFQRSREYNRLAFRKDSTNLLRESTILTLQAAEMGHVKAMSNLVSVYTKANGSPSDHAKAVEWAGKLMALDKGVGYYHMGVMLQRGIGVRQNQKAALAYIRRSADLGNSYGQFEIGEKMLEAFAQSPDKVTGQAIGAALLQCALDQGLTKAGYELGFHYGVTVKDGMQALKIFQQTAKLGHKESLFKLHRLFNEGDYGIAKDPQRANCYYEKYKIASRNSPDPIPDLDTTCPLPPKPMPAQT